MTTARRLIINADDFGQSAGVNRGILEGHDLGVITSTSLMVRWPSAAEAARAAVLRPRLSVGLHVDLGEWMLRDNEWVPVYHVVNTEDGEAVAAEVRNQLDTFRRLMGREPSHLDSHQHVHRQEPVRSLLTALAGKLNVPLRHFAAQIRYCGDFYGQNEWGTTLPAALSVEHLLNILSSLPPGMTELACHAGYPDGLNSMYCDERKQELLVLCDPRIQQAIREFGIELCSFHDLGGKSEFVLSAKGVI